MALRDESVTPAFPQGHRLRRPGAEPLPGYRLIEVLGSGGFGEVWKCEAPGGLFKAVKFVGGDTTASGSLAAQELEAIQRIKSIRHPFLLSLERVEVIDEVLVLVMELADRNLQCVLLDYQGRGLPGIPRDPLLRFLREAAEALDVINFQHGLQHLDVKPHNLFVVGNHVKVADFGLVHRLPRANSNSWGQFHGAGTPLYAAPETLQGSLSRHSDQYSLAIVYQQLLTGTLPFWSANTYQLMTQHISGAPDLSALPSGDRQLVGRALAKSPNERFASCMAFVQALSEAADPASAIRPSLRSTPPEAPLKPPDGGTRLPPARIAQPEALTGSLIGAADLPQPAGPSLPGYRFLDCVGRTPLGCLWTVRGPDGRERLAHCLLDVGEFAAESLARLQALRHPALPDREVFWVPPACLVLITDMGRQTLRERFDNWRTGLPGIPRPTLLGRLAEAAEALDELHRAENLCHLGINPTRLLVEGDRVLLEDFGLTPLFWLPSGRPAAQLNPRYAAPELSDPVSSQSADQYSLALVYTEMLTGIYPRTKPPGGTSGMHRRPGASDAGSGLHRRPVLPPHRQAGLQGAVKVDLDFLPADDRPVVARALHDDPAQRFPTCTAFVEALRAATPAPVVAEGTSASLPLVAPFAYLMGKPPPHDAPVPRTDQVAAALVAAAAGAVKLHEIDDIRYIVYPDGAWEHRFPIQIVASLLGLKLEGFRLQWNGESAPRTADSFAFRIQTSNGKGGFWPRSKAAPAGLNVQVRFRPADGPDAAWREVVVRVGPFGESGLHQETLLPSTAPRIFQSLRAYLQGHPEQRLWERWPFAQRVGVYPVLGHREIGQVLEGLGRDVSLGGIRLLAPRKPLSEFAYLHFYETPKAAPLAVLGRIVHVQSFDEGGYELGVAFAVEGAPVV